MKNIALAGSLLLLLSSPLLAPPALAGAGVPVPEHVQPEERAEVVGAIDRWRQAVIDADRAGLEAAYHPGLAYGHSDGAVVGRDEQIARTLVAGRRFTAVDVSDLAVRAYGPVAYVTAGYAFHIASEGQPARVARLAGLDVWTRTDNGWQLIARQLTQAAP